MVDGDLPLAVEVRAHFSFHLTDLAVVEHSLCDDGPGLVTGCVVAYDLGGDHEG